ncbi:winged helix-turn-helix domain-containing protein [Thiotrichales bacterium 19S11-10]|nr:winged helix-turn-helix domain-containing protein [Thiotrichales bacterium 19S11-10]
MQWELLGFQDDPFKTHPITSYTLELYTGNKDKIDQAFYALNSDNVIMVIEGERGVGTTSFGNFIRFTSHNNKKYFTPTGEIKVEPNWNADTLMAAIIGNLVTTLELNHLDEIAKDNNFIEAKSVVSRITDTYRNFGLSGLGFGGNYGVAGATTQPMIMPTPMLAHHFEGLIKLVKKIGYKHGVLVQLNNLDVGTVQDEKHLALLLNVMRDYFQIPGSSWLLVGDTELRKFIAQKIDRLDDIIGCDIEIIPLSNKDYTQLIQKRVEHFRTNENVKLPVDQAVWDYLFQVTHGRLRYIFGLLNRLYNAFKLGELTDFINIDMAKPAIKQFGEQRILRHKLSPTEISILQAVVEDGPIQVSELADNIKKSQTHVSRILNSLHELKLVSYRQEWRNRFYSASIDAQLAYNNV